MPYKRPQRKQYKRVQQKPRAPKQYVPGWGGVVGRGLGLAQKHLTSKGSVAHKALSLARKVADAVNIEYKDIEDKRTVTPNWAGTIISLVNGISQGVGNAQRVGDSLKMQRLTVRGYCNITSAAANVEYMRLIVFIDKSNTIANCADLLDTASSTFVSLSPKNDQTKYNTVILYDQPFKMIKSTVNEIVPFEINLPIDLHVNYSTGSTDVRTNDLKVAFIGQTTAATGGSFVWFSNLSYTDD